MKNSESGEFELVLGNRQLLSGFFIVVILFGVFFTMGYIVGRNSAAPRTAGVSEGVSEYGAAPAAQALSQPPAVQSGQPAAAEPSESAAAAPAGEGSAAPQTGTQPVVQPGSAAPAAAPAQAAAPAPMVLPPPDKLVEPAPGEVFLQVMAVKRPEAEVVLKTLRDRGFRAVLGQGPNELLRVLVGPFADRESLTQAKAGLENAGFHPIVRK